MWRLQYVVFNTFKISVRSQMWCHTMPVISANARWRQENQNSKSSSASARPAQATWKHVSNIKQTIWMVNKQELVNSIYVFEIVGTTEFYWWLCFPGLLCHHEMVVSVGEKIELGITSTVNILWCQIVMSLL